MISGQIISTALHLHRLHQVYRVLSALLIVHTSMEGHQVAITAAPGKLDRGVFHHLEQHHNHHVVYAPELVMAVKVKSDVETIQKISLRVVATLTVNSRWNS